MNNIIKMFSANKDFRMVIADTYQIAEKGLDNSTRGLLMQPLPFADEKIMAKNDAELVYLSKRLEQANWQEVISIYSHLANVVSENKME